ncbi:hypothetical protein Vretimale_15562 [Volvox reticuliferus]|nr:hypothetical protein Vretimale_15562 [Volvox reticuliferus]
MVTWALVPADDDMLRYMINKGRRDARAWAQRMLLVPQDAAANLTGGEGAGDIGGGAERAAERVRQAQAQREAVAEGLGSNGDGTGLRGRTGDPSVAKVTSAGMQSCESGSGSER